MSEDEALKKVLLANVPQGRLIKPAEVGVMAAYLCADEASAVTGAALQIDCGWTAR
jgi:3-hydroxybutyrate dehydrogenase